jgi:hypothetical protein
LKRPQTEDARSIGQAYQLKPPNLQHFPAPRPSLALRRNTPDTDGYPNP